MRYIRNSRPQRRKISSSDHTGSPSSQRRMVPMIRSRSCGSISYSFITHPDLPRCSQSCDALLHRALRSHRASTMLTKFFAVCHRWREHDKAVHGAVTNDRCDPFLTSPRQIVEQRRVFVGVRIFWIDPYLDDLDIRRLFAVLGDGDEVRHDVDDIMRAIRTAQIGGVNADQPSAIPKHARRRDSRQLVIDSTALTRALMLTALATGLADVFDWQESATECAAPTLAFDHLFASKIKTPLARGLDQTSG